MTPLLWVLAAVAAALSAYGWWFHFSVGPTHGPGMEFGIIGAIVAIVTMLGILRARRGR